MRFGPVFAFGLLGFLGVSAKADTLQPVTVTGNGFGGSGTLYATDNQNGSYTITGVTGSGFERLFAVGGFRGNDNLLFPGTDRSLDGNGFSFLDTQDDTTYQVRIYSVGPDAYALQALDIDNIETDGSITFSLDNPTSMTPAVHQALLRMSNETPITSAFAFSFAPNTDTGTPPATVTPEPSSFALLGTGFLGVAGLVSRRRRA